MIFHDRVKYLLQKAGIKQQEFAETLNISPARLNNYLTGKAEANYRLLRDIALSLNTTLDYLISGGMGRISQNILLKKEFFPNIKGELISYCVDESYGDFPIRVRSILKYRNISQLAFASLLNITPARLSGYLSGKTEMAYSMVVRFAEVLGTSIDYLLGLSADFGEKGYSEGIDAKYLGVSNVSGDVFIKIPMFDSLSGEKIGYEKSCAVLKNIFVKPYLIYVSDTSMEPNCKKGDILFVAPRTYIPPTSQNLDPDRLYAVSLHSDDKIGVSVRYCLTKDNILFMRPMDLSFSTIGLDVGIQENFPVKGIILCRFTS